MSIQQGFLSDDAGNVYVYQENDNINAPSVNTSAAFGLIKAENGAWALTVSALPGATPDGGGGEATILFADFETGNVTINPIGSGSVIINGLVIPGTDNIIIDVPHDNIFIGHGVGNGQVITAYNTIMGANAAQALTTSTSNVILGYNSGHALTTGGKNTLLSAGTGSLLVGGSANVAAGIDALSFLTSGIGNVVISGNATNFGGQNYTSSESYNVLLSAQGVTGEDSVFRVGDGFGSGPGLISAVYIQGIEGVEVGNTLTAATCVVVNNSGQLGQVQFTSLNGSVKLTQTDNAHLDFSSTSSHAATSATATVTANYPLITATYTGFTTAASATQVFIISSTSILATSGMFVNVTNLNGSGNNAKMQLVNTTQAAGSIHITVLNAGSGALDGVLDNVIISLQVLS